MADGTTIEGADDATRIPLRDRPQRQAAAEGGEKDKTPAITVTEAEPAEPVDPEKHVAEITKSLQNANSTAENEHRRANDEAQRRQRAERENQDLKKFAKTSQHAVVAAAVETTGNELARAKQALVTARGAGDVDGEAKALGDIAAAAALNAHAKQELASLDVADPTSPAGKMVDPGTQTTQQTTRQAPTMDARSQAWVDAHPRFRNDQVYRKAVMDAHNQAINELKIPEFSEAYFAHMDGAAAAIARGEDPTSGADNMTDPTDPKPAPKRGASFQGARPNGNGASPGATKTYKTPISDLTVTTRADGTKTIRVPPTAVAEYKEYAEINGMKYEDYIQGLVGIEEEKGDGRYPGIITTEGGIYK
jgi:hypothetical protein